MSPVSGFQIVTRRKKCPNVAISFPSRLHAAAVTSLLCTSSLRWWIARSWFVSEREVGTGGRTNGHDRGAEQQPKPSNTQSVESPNLSGRWSLTLWRCRRPNGLLIPRKRGSYAGKWLLTENSPCQPGTPNFRAKPLAGGVAAQRRAGGGSLTRPSDGRIAAVDQQIAAGNKARHIARQIDRRTRDLLGPSQAAEQMLAADLLVRRGKRAVT